MTRLDHKSISTKGMSQRIKRFLPTPGSHRTICTGWSTNHIKYLPVLLCQSHNNKLTITVKGILDQTKAVNKAKEILSKYGFWIETRVIIDPETNQQTGEKIYLVHQKNKQEREYYNENENNCSRKQAK